MTKLFWIGSTMSNCEELQMILRDLITRDKMVYEIQWLRWQSPNFIFTFIAKLTINIQKQGSDAMLDNAMKIKPILLFILPKSNAIVVIFRKTTEQNWVHHRTTV